MKNIITIIRLLKLLKKRNIAIAVIAIMRLVMLFFPDLLTTDQYIGVREIIDWALFGGAIHSFSKATLENKKAAKQSRRNIRNN